mmetsp:Transcript_28844/g.43558  ORF Transcript_28844/g.43558 Transcript_28844/m.43558 type:complete len:106 (+) Transcript_28844:524-841(+)
MDILMAKRLETSTMSPFEKSIDTSIMHSGDGRDDPLSGCVTSLGEASIGIPTFAENSTRNNPSPLGPLRGALRPASFTKAADLTTSTQAPSLKEESSRWSQVVKL